MVGDVNIFLTDPTDPSSAELEIMIAGDAQRLCPKKDYSEAKVYQASTIKPVFWFLHVKHFPHISQFQHCFPAVVC